MLPTVLLTRPEAAARRFAAALVHLGLPVVISPALRILPVAHDGRALARAGGLVFTSVHAIPAAGAARGRPAICVGPATAEAARKAGFEVTEGPGDAEGMLPLLQDLGPGWLHPHGAHIARELPVQGMIVYDQVALSPSTRARDVLSGSGPVILPLFSPRSAKLVSDWVGRAVAPLWLASISAAARAAWHADAARSVTAMTPDAAGMRAAIETLLAGEPPIARRVEAPRGGD
ncbi:uroporphyrinogen-III synthase [Paracoccus ravus]|uniref:uroporphyrinogen-III synthase n=1 Tax=Paracoccus ravus TaxID=2447760 RepID=UPI00106E823D|nr:uroporphyrinogen-III synthase [Paracoccus ravus]